MKITPEDYVRTMLPFLSALPRMTRVCAAAPSLRHYGTGESDSWAVQTNQQVMAGLAVLSAEPGLEVAGCPWPAERLRETALSMLRYSLRTHATGDLAATDGRQWGRHWISVLGLERATPGLNALRSYLDDDDRARLRALVAYEADYRLQDYPVEAAIDNATGRNKPESNIWNGGFLLRAAADYPDLPNAAAYAAKGTKLVLNGLSHPADERDETPVLGRPVRDWVVGSNFTENWSLDHHGYMNVGYSYVCLSNLALLYFNFRERGQPVPDGLLHNARALWETVRRFTFPDGRLLRIGGDSRARYAYCQCFAIHAWLLAAALWDDPDAVRFERGYLDIVRREQRDNPDGTFFGRRLSRMREEGAYFWNRLEADPFSVLACGARWRRAFRLRDEAPGAAGERPGDWSDDFHGAALRRGGGVVRSAVARAFQGGTRPLFACGGIAPSALCLPLGRSDMAEWSGNLFGFLGLRGPSHGRRPDGASWRVEKTEGGFRWTWDGPVFENLPAGEGEGKYAVLHRTAAAEALGDGRTLVLCDRVAVVKETTLPAGYRSLHLQIPNDVQNGRVRHWKGPGFSLDTHSEPGEAILVRTPCRALNVDDAIAVFSLSGRPLSLYRPGRQNVTLANGLTSAYAEEVCLDCETGPVHLRPGVVLFDAVYAVSAATTAAETLARPDRGRVEGEGESRVAVFAGFDGRDYAAAIPLPPAAPPHPGTASRKEP